MVLSYDDFGVKFESGSMFDLGRFEKMLLVACKGKDQVDAHLLEQSRRKNLVS